MTRVFSEAEIRNTLRKYDVEPAYEIAADLGISLSPVTYKTTSKVWVHGDDLWLPVSWNGVYAFKQQFPDHKADKFFEVTIKEIL